MKSNEKYKINIKKSISYLSKINDTKMFIIGLIFGLFISVISHILLLPLNYQITGIEQNNTMINLIYGNIILFNISLNGFVLLFLLGFLVMLAITWKFIIREIYGIPSEGDESEFIHNERPDVLAGKLKKRLKNIIELDSDLSYRYKVESTVKKGNCFVFLFEGEDDEPKELDDSDFIIEIRKGNVTIRYKPKKEIIDLIKRWNENNS